MIDPNNNNLSPFDKQSVKTSSVTPGLQTTEVVTPGLFSRIRSFYSENRIYFFAIIIAVIVIGIMAYFAFRPQSAPPTQAQVNVSIDAPQDVQSGGEVVYKIKVENQDKVAMNDVKLQIVYPYGMSYVSSSPQATNLSGTSFTLPNIGPNQNAVLLLKARVQGNINDEKRLQATAVFKYGELTAEFSKSADKAVRLIASDVALEIEGPSNTNNAQIVEYRIKYQNNSDRQINNARIQVAYPEGFSFASSTPNADLGGNTWNIGNVASGKQGEIIVQGSYKGAQPGQAATITGSFLVLDQQGGYFTQATTTFTTAISSLPLLVTQDIQQQGDAGLVVNPGDRVRYSVHYQNNGTVVARGVNIVATIDSRAIDLSSIRAEGGQVSNNTIVWNAASVNKLENLNPSEGGNLEFEVAVKNPAVKDTSTNVDIKTTIKIKSSEYNDFLPGNDLQVKIATQPSVKGSLEYLSGSLPPKVGTNTSYRVTIALRNTTNDITDSTLTAFIPLPAGSFNASTLNNEESGNVKFDPASGKLTWNLGKVPANVGVFNPVRKLTFTVTINPAISQSGSEVLLVKDIVWSGTDSYTQRKTNAKASNITTANLPGNDGYYNGQVVQ